MTEDLDRLNALAAAATPGRKPGLWVIFDGPPGPESGRFVEVEDGDGMSVGPQGKREWRKEGDLWALGPFDDPDTIRALIRERDEAVREREELRAAALSLVGALPYEPGSMLGGKIALVRAALHREDGA